ncbi:MAG: 2-phosphosulfolactate phosphatase [candidate division Zixibacteria bacterium]|nr:2-phosphosulfolactate phosphatase [candidate division Zixibacteria bacterium]
MNVQLFLTSLPLHRVDLEDRTVVVIDILRCSTSICAMLAAGAKGVIPTERPGEAGEMWSKLGADSAVLAGERGGVKVENFQYGNSPLEFTPETVGGKNVVLCTTNGTKAFVSTQKGGLVLSGALVNISRVSEAVARRGKDLVVVCSGTEGGFSIEDTLCGGLLIHQLTTVHKLSLTLNDAGSLAVLLYRANQTSLAKAIAQGEHGRFLASIGFADDVRVAAEVDSMPVLAVMRDGRLMAEERSPD